MIFDASELQECLDLCLKFGRIGNMNAAFGKYINILIHSYSNLKYEMLWKWWFLWSVWLQIVLQKLSPFFPGLERQQYDFKNLQNWSTKCENFTNVLAALSDFNLAKFCAAASHEKSRIFKAVFISEQAK